MRKKYKITNNWLKSLDLIIKKPVLLLPFFIIAFLEALAAEIIWFAPREPIAFVAAPIIRKFFGEQFLHYPFNFAIYQKLFYYGQVVIYIFAGVFLMGISINIFKNIKEGLPIKRRAMVKNASKRYLSFFGFGIITIILMVLLNNFGSFAFLKFMKLVGKFLPQIILKLAPVAFSICIFIAGAILQVLTVLTIPIIVLRHKSLLKALGGSLYLAIKNFFTIFGLIFLPFLIYLPISLLKSFSARLAGIAFPEINLYITGLGVIMSIFIDCFIAICAAQWLMDAGETRS